jgi:hypothetical protein
MMYLASPYSDPDPSVCEARFDATCRATAELLRRGVLVFSPVVHSHPLVRFQLPTSWDYWGVYDRAYLRLCDRLTVLTLDGWRESRGVQAEIDLAIDMDLPIAYWSPEMISNMSGGDTSINVRPSSQETSI